MSDDANFLARWSRLKEESRKASVPPASEHGPGTSSTSVAAERQSVARVPDAALPPIEHLDFDSDFTGFLRAEIAGSVKRAALKKLFHTPHFNQMDGLDVYIEDYNSFEPIPDSMLRELRHAREVLFPAEAQGDEPAHSVEDAASSETGAAVAQANTATDVQTDGAVIAQTEDVRSEDDVSPKVSQESDT